jgi:hypothetical protein
MIGGIRGFLPCWPKESSTQLLLMRNPLAVPTLFLIGQTPRGAFICWKLVYCFMQQGYSTADKTEQHTGSNSLPPSTTAKITVPMIFAL